MNISRILLLTTVLLGTAAFGFASTLDAVRALQPLVVFTQSDCGFCPSPSVGSHDFKLGVKNNDQNNPIDVQFFVNGIGSTGDNFALASECITVPAKSSSNNNPLTVTFTSAEIGETFTVTYALEWGTSCSYLPNTLSRPSTSFTVVP